jgi:hypothetical protein
MRWISCFRRAGIGYSPRTEDPDAGDRQIGLHRLRQRRLRHTGQPRVFGLRGRIDGARPPWIVDDFRSVLGQDDVAERKVEGGRCSDRTAPVDQSWTIRRHDYVAGV